MNPARFFLALWLLSISAFAFAADDGLVAIPKLERRVTDASGTLTSEQAAALEQRIAQFEKARGSQIAILLVPSTLPEPIEDYSIRVAESWKIGRKKHDDGVLMVVAKNDRALRIEVGYGLEGALTDATSKRIIEEIVLPRFKAGDFYAGLTAGVEKIQAVIEGEQLPAPAATNGGTGGDNSQLLILALMAAVGVAGVLNAVFGRLFGSGATGGLAALIAVFLGFSLLAAVGVAVAVFIFALLAGTPGLGRHYGGGGFGRGGGGGGFSGGGGGFGGGGASGRW